MPITNVRVVTAELEFRVGFTESNAQAVERVEKALENVQGKITSVTVKTT